MNTSPPLWLAFALIAFALCHNACNTTTSSEFGIELRQESYLVDAGSRELQQPDQQPAPDRVQPENKSHHDNASETQADQPHDEGISEPVTNERPPDAPKPSLYGYWLWEQVIEGGKVTRTITDDDMWPKMDSTGWPGCPDGIFCTRYGIKKVAFGKTKIHLHHNVMTSSDYQTIGSFRARSESRTQGIVEVDQHHSFSCAHPAASYPGPSSNKRYFRYKFQGGKLWLSGAHGHLSDREPPPTTDHWIVYKKILVYGYYGRFMIRFCQEDPGLKCHKDCFSKVLVDP